MKTLQFKNKNGDLSVYSFACGYIQEKETLSGRVELYRDGSWHVRKFDKGERLLWDCFDTLGEARKAFKAA
jgi:hypothetical protein